LLFAVTRRTLPFLRQQGLLQADAPALPVLSRFAIIRPQIAKIRSKPPNPLMNITRRMILLTIDMIFIKRNVTNITAYVQNFTQKIRPPVREPYLMPVMMWLVTL
jgi:hypothetical protein